MAAAHAGPAVEAVAGPGCRVSGFELEFREAGGALRWEALSMCAAEPLEDALPVRPFHFEKGAVSFAVWRWFVTTGRRIRVVAGARSPDVDGFGPGHHRGRCAAVLAALARCGREAAAARPGLLRPPP